MGYKINYSSAHEERRNTGGIGALFSGELRRTTIIVIAVCALGLTAHWAMMFSHYQYQYGITEEDLAQVSIQVRRNAMRHPSAVMQQPIDLEDYLKARYIVRPLHLFDICIVNDGAVCLIVRKADMARGLKQVPVDVAGWSYAKIKDNKLDQMVRQQLRPQMQQARDEAFAMAGVTLDDVQHFEGYDASTMHLINHVEGFGFTHR